MKERGREQLVANVRQPFVMLGYRVLVHRSDFINSRAEHLRRVRMLAYLPSNCQPNTCYPNNPTIANFAQRPRIYKHIDNRPHREIFHSRQSFSRFYTNVAARVYTRVNSLRVYIFHGCAIVPLWQEVTGQNGRRDKKRKVSRLKRRRREALKEGRKELLRLKGRGEGS